MTAVHECVRRVGNILDNDELSAGVDDSRRFLRVCSHVEVISPLCGWVGCPVRLEGSMTEARAGLYGGSHLDIDPPSLNFCGAERSIRLAAGTFMRQNERGRGRERGTVRPRGPIWSERHLRPLSMSGGESNANLGENELYPVASRFVHLYLSLE